MNKKALPPPDAHGKVFLPNCWLFSFCWHLGIKILIWLGYSHSFRFNGILSVSPIRSIALHEVELLNMQIWIMVTGRLYSLNGSLKVTLTRSIPCSWFSSWTHVFCLLQIYYYKYVTYWKQSLHLLHWYFISLHQVITLSGHQLNGGIVCYICSQLTDTTFYQLFCFGFIL